MADLTMTTDQNNGQTAQAESTYGARSFTPRVDILETEGDLLLFAEMPGVKPENVDLRYENGELTLRGKVEARPERRNLLLNEYEEGDFYRVFRIDETVDAGKIEAHCKNGVLKLTLPKVEAVRPRQIAVKTA